MNENQFGHGARPINKVHRFLNRKMGRQTVKGMSLFDWNTGFDVRDKIGPITIKNQGTNDSCSGQAGSYFLEIQRKLQGIKESDLSAKSIYAPIAYPGGGTTIPYLETALATTGANFEQAVPSYDSNGNPFPEAQMVDISWETVALSQDALTRAGYTPIDIPRDIDSVASAIQQYGAVIWEITGQNNGTWTSSIPLAPNPGSQNPLWHHFMCAIGARMLGGKKVIVALQSMGSSWGDNGIQYFTEDYFNSGYIVDVFSFIYDKQLVPASDETIWQAVANWFRRQPWFWSLQGAAAS